MNQFSFILLVCKIAPGVRYSGIVYWFIYFLAEVDKNIGRMPLRYYCFFNLFFRTRKWDILWTRYDTFCERVVVFVHVRSQCFFQCIFFSAFYICWQFFIGPDWKLFPQKWSKWRQTLHYYLITIPIFLNQFWQLHFVHRN